MFEETGCVVEAVGIVDIFNRIYDDMNIVNFLFDMKLMDENIRVDGKEISDARWFNYDEIVSMKDKLRADAFFIDSLKKKEKSEILPLDTITINRYFKKNS